MSFLRRIVARLAGRFPSKRTGERLLVLQALGIAQQNRTRTHLRGLHEAEFSAYSQWGEDGIIDWLISRLPGVSPTFVEFGVEDYREANTRLLLPLRNWRGLVIDGSDENVARIVRDEISWRHDLSARCAFVTTRNINALITEAGLPTDIGLLSIDIDGNDYWIWREITVVRPAIVVCEYNAVLGDRRALTVPYAAEFRRTEAHSSNLYFGASIRALIELGREKGYAFVGTNANGCNAFFVRDDLAPPILGGLRGRYLFPSRFREARSPDGALAFTSGAARAPVIRGMSVVDLAQGITLRLEEIGELESNEWASGQPSLYSGGSS